MEGLGPHTPVTLVAEHATNLVDLFLRRVQASGQYTAYFHKVDTQWVPTSWSSWQVKAMALAQALIDQGCSPGDRVAILGPTRPEWAICEMAVQFAGCISVGIYPKQSSEQISYILQHSEAKVVLVDSTEELKTVLQASRTIESLEHIIPGLVQTRSTQMNRE